MAELIYTEIPDILGWFKTGEYPTQQQFAASWTSFWHKSELIPVTRIEGLVELLEEKADYNVLQYYAKTDAANIDAIAWRNVLGVGEVDLSSYYTKTEVNTLLASVTVDLSNYHTITQYQEWTTTGLNLKENLSNKKNTWSAIPTDNEYPSAKLVKDTIDANQPATAVQASSSTESATETNRFLTTFSIWKWLQALTYIILKPNATAAIANRLRSDGAKLYYANNSAVEKAIAYDENGVNVSVLHLSNTSINILTSGDSNNYKMHGKSIIHENTTNATITVVATTNFICKGIKVNTGNITFVAGTDITIIQADSTLTVNGNKGSSYVLERLTATEYLLSIKNI